MLTSRPPSLCGACDDLAFVVRTDSQGRVLAANAHAQALGVAPGTPLFQYFADPASSTFWTTFLARATFENNNTNSSKNATLEDEVLFELLPARAAVFCRVVAGGASGETCITVCGVRTRSRTAPAQQALVFDRGLLDHAGNSVVATDVEGRCIYWNDVASEIYGYTADEVVGDTTDKMIEPSSFEYGMEIMESLRKGRPWSGEFNCLRKDGTPILVNSTNFPLFGADGKTLVGIVGVSCPVGSGVDSAAKARNREDVSQPAPATDTQAAQPIADATFVTLAEGSTKITDCGSAFEEYVGKSPIGEDVLELFVNPGATDMSRLSSVPRVRDSEIREFATFQKALASRSPSNCVLLIFDASSNAWRCVNVHVKFPRQGGGAALLLVTNISAEQKLFFALEKADAATVANHTKTKFLTAMSHELRTPLHGISAETELLLCRFTEGKHSTTPADVDEIINSLRVISTCSQIQLGLVNNLLDLRRIEEGKLTISANAFNLVQVTENVLRVCGAMAQLKGISLEVVVEHAPFRSQRIVSDEMRISEVLMNFIGNATKHCPKGSSIQIALKSDIAGDRNSAPSARAAIFVRDDGVGVDASRQGKLFDAFQHSVTGSGLGLSICREIATLMGGRVWHEERKPRGSVFAFEFPYTYALEGSVVEQELQQTMRRRLDSGLARCNTKLHSFSSEQENAKAVDKPIRASEPPRDSTPAVSNENPLAQIRILVAEDNAINMMVLLKLLAKCGVQKSKIQTVDNGLKALESIQSGKRFDLILMDLMMPVMGGIEASARIRELDSSTPICAVTAHAMETHKDEAQRVGINEYLTKPIGLRDLQSCLARVAK